MSDTDKNEMIIGGIFWIIIIAIGYWYWHCSDGVRAVENMTVDQIMEQGISGTTPVINDNDFLKNQGYNTTITFKEALEKMGASNVKFKSSNMKMPDNNGDAVKAVEVNANFNPPWEGFKSIIMYIGVQKKHFWNFNPSIVAPFKTIYINEKGGSSECSIFNNMEKTIEPIYRCFKEK